MQQFNKGDFVRVKLEDGRHLISAITYATVETSPYALVRGLGTVHNNEEFIQKIDCKGLRFLYTLNGPFIEEEYSGV